MYGIMSYAVVRRTGEIGVRMALGPQRLDILRLFLQETLLLVMIGLAQGVHSTSSDALDAQTELIDMRACTGIGSALH
jgi:ABC-type lipoprotein release transport system permease subunit